MRKYLKGQQGFTLIELMVVVLIIGILVAIAIPVFQSTQRTAKERACKASIRTMEGAIQQFNAESIEFNSGAALTGLGQLVSTYYTGGTYGPWLKAVPTCPSAGTYSVSGGTVSCTVHGTL